jgi:hypothetical protein
MNTTKPKRRAANRKATTEDRQAPAERDASVASLHEQHTASPQTPGGSHIHIAVNGGDDGKYKFALKALDRTLKFRLLRISIGVSLLLIAAAAGIHAWNEAFGPKEPAIKIELNMSQAEADRRLKLTDSGFYFCLYNKMEIDRARCLKKQIMSWERWNGGIDLTENAIIEPQVQSPPAVPAPEPLPHTTDAKKSRAIIKEEQKRPTPVARPNCFLTLLNPNACGPNGAGGTGSGGASGSEGVPTFR